MKYKQHPLRHELKYLINSSQYLALAAEFDSVLQPDRHSVNGGYFIRSLYFDDVYSSCYCDKSDGVQRRRKYRIRCYNHSDKTIKFEIKDKYDAYISKMSAVISREQYQRMILCDFDFMLDSPSQVLRLGFIDARLKLLRPRVIVDYIREAFVCEEGNVRVTFDSDLRAAVGGFDIFDRSLATLPAMPANSLTLEVKYDDYLPRIVQRLLAPLSNCQTSLSKFMLCRDAQTGFYRKEVINV